MFSNVYITAIAATLGVITIVIAVAAIVYLVMRLIDKNEEKKDLPLILANYRAKLLKLENYEEIIVIDKFIKLVREGKNLPKEFYNNYEIKYQGVQVFRYDDEEEAETHIFQVRAYLVKKAQPTNKKNNKKKK